MELVILAKSPLCKPDTGFMGKVLEAIEVNIESILLSMTVAALGALTSVGLLRAVAVRVRWRY